MKIVDLSWLMYFMVNKNNFRNFHFYALIMSTNKHATIRYLALDKCFRNPGKKYFIEDLIKVCNAIVDNGGKEPLLKCVIYGAGNMAYRNANGVYILPLTSLKQ